MEQLIVNALFILIGVIFVCIVLTMIYVLKSGLKTLDYCKALDREEFEGKKKALKVMIRCQDMDIVEDMAIHGAITYDFYIKLSRMEDDDFYKWYYEYFNTPKEN